MADLPPNTPQGAVPPPKKETGKVQPKKETVRINLPPKPSAAPTIKLPTLPPGGPTGAPSAPAPAAMPAAPAPGAQLVKSAASAHQAPAPAKSNAAPVQRPVVAPVAVVPSIKGLDKGLIYAGAVFSLAAVGLVTWVYMTLQSTVDTFTP